jgi:hypothetical protein
MLSISWNVDSLFLFLKKWDTFCTVFISKVLQIKAQHYFIISIPANFYLDLFGIKMPKMNNDFILFLLMIKALMLNK